MTIAQQLQQQGMQQEKYHIAVKLLEKDIPIEVIADSTDLTEEEIEKLKSDSTH